MHVRDFGTGIPVLLLPGCPTPAEHMMPLARLLSARHRVLLPDLPGYGESPKLEGEYTIRRAQRVIEDALLERGVRELAIVGMSVGAYRAFALSLSSRLQVNAVVSLGGFANMPREARDTLRQFATMLRAGSNVREAFLARMFSERYMKSHPREMQDVSTWLEQSDRAVVAAELDATANGDDLISGIRQLSIPILLRVGERDVATPPVFSEEIARNARNATLEVVPGCGHLLLLEDWDRTAAAIQRTLEH
jgi:pimeloyl-ACP methyl ester carboxylesterase